MPVTQESCAAGNPETDRALQRAQVFEQLTDGLLGALADGRDQEDGRVGERAQHGLRRDDGSQ